MVLYFDNGRSERREIGHPKDEKEALKTIKQFCRERNFKIYYTRTWEKNNTVYYDVGSHAEFFMLDKSEQNDSSIHI